MLKKRTAVYLIVVMLTCILAACGTPKESPPTGQSQPSTAEVNLTCDPLVEGKTLVLAGTASVPDGAILVYQVQSQQLDALEAQTEGTITVSGGHWQAKVDLAKFPKGTIEIWVAFQTVMPGISQPEDILRLYGEKGEKMTGAQVVTSGDLKRAELIKTINY